MLTQVLTGGLLQYEYVFSADGKLLRTNIYNPGGGQTELNYYYLCEYNTDGTRKLDMQYNSNTGVVKRLYTYNDQGKVSRRDVAIKNTTLDNLDKIDHFETFDYDAKGQLIKITQKEANQTLMLTRQYAYDDKGNCIHVQLHIMDDGELEIRENNVIVPGEKQMPELWKKLLIEPDDMDLYQFFAKERTLTDYWIFAAGRVTNFQYPNRVRNNQGLVTSETIEAYRDGVLQYSENRNYDFVAVK